MRCSSNIAGLVARTGDAKVVRVRVERPHPLVCSEAATYAPNDSFQIDLYDLFMLKGVSIFRVHLRLRSIFPRGLRLGND